ncbi:toxin-antitoxin system HicB family antitoxin [Streptomyces sp. T-3]|nr:toxin-antitoxin system HicB family antitoxin [Streptomyces sp. T-3]
MEGNEKQLNVRVKPRTHALIKKKAARHGVSVQAFVSGLVESEVDPDREAFVSGLVDDMTELLPEFEDAFEVGQR